MFIDLRDETWQQLTHNPQEMNIEDLVSPQNEDPQPTHDPQPTEDPRTTEDPEINLLRPRAVRHGEDADLPPIQIDLSPTFIDETTTTQERAHGKAVPQNDLHKFTKNLFKSTTKRKYHRRRPVIHNDGYDWRKFGQKVDFCPCFSILRLIR